MHDFRTAKETSGFLFGRILCEGKGLFSESRVILISIICESLVRNHCLIVLLLFKSRTALEKEQNNIWIMGFLISLCLPFNYLSDALSTEFAGARLHWRQCRRLRRRASPIHFFLGKNTPPTAFISFFFINTSTCVDIFFLSRIKGVRWETQ